jgi:hypothetical protein
MSEREGIVKVLPPGEVGEVLEAEWWETSATPEDTDEQEAETEQTETEEAETKSEKKKEDKLLGRGWVALIVLFLFIAIGGFFWFAKSFSPKEKTKETSATDSSPAARQTTQAPVVIPEYPTSGEGHATKEAGIKAWLDPMKTYVRPSRPARYVFVEDTTLFFDDTSGAVVDTTAHHKEWLQMPAGKYLVYPIKDDDNIFFRWWQ